MVYQPIVSFAIKMKELRVEKMSRMFFCSLCNLISTVKLFLNVGSSLPLDEKVNIYM